MTPGLRYDDARVVAGSPGDAHPRNATREQAHAELTLQMLQGAVVAPAACDVEWGLWRRLAERNKVLIRLTARLAGGPLHPPAVFLAAAARERLRVQGILAVTQRMADACTRHAIPHVFLNTHRHYPDMGRDIDLLVPHDATNVDRLLLAGLRASACQRDLRHRIAGTTTYLLYGGAVVLDIHHGRLGQCGEQRLFPRFLLEHRRLVEIAGQAVWAPSPQDDVVLQGLQQVWGRRSFRLADALHTIAAVRDARLDWDDIRWTARQVGAVSGLSCYLAYVCQIYQRLFARPLLPRSIARALRLDGWGRVEFKDGAFRFPALQVSSRLYARRFGADVRSGRWESAGRLCFLPLVAAAAAVAHLLPPADLVQVVQAYQDVPWF